MGCAAQEEPELTDEQVQETSQYAELEEELAEAQDQRDRMANQLSELENERDEIVDERDQLQKELSNVKEERNQLEDELSDLQEEHDDLADERDELQAKVEELRSNRQDLQRRLAELEGKEQRIEELQKQLSQLENDLQQVDEAEVDREGDFVVITLGEQVLFDEASAELHEDARETLRELADVLDQYPDREIRVEGHADTRPILTHEYADNWELAADRSLSVLRFFETETSIAGNRLAATTFGEHKPRVRNDSEENMQENRRVEIYLYPPELPREDLNEEDEDSNDAMTTTGDTSAN